MLLWKRISCALLIFLTMWIGVKVGGRHESAEQLVEICFVIGIICYMYFIPSVELTSSEVTSRNLFLQKTYYKRESIKKATVYRSKHYIKIQFEDGNKLMLRFVEGKCLEKLISYLWEGGVECKTENDLYVPVVCKLDLKEETAEKTIEFAKQATRILIERLQDIKCAYQAAGIDLEIGLIHKNEIRYNYEKLKWWQLKEQVYAISIRFKKNGKYFKGIMYPCLELRINLVIRDKKGLLLCITNYEECFIQYWKYQLINALIEVKLISQLPKTIEKRPLEEFI